MNRLRINAAIQRADSKPLIPLPLTLTRKQIYILPTRYGLLFIIVLLALLAGSVNYKNNLGFLLTFLLGSMMFISIFHSYRNLYGLQIVSVAAKPVFCGEEANFTLHIRPGNHSRVAVAFMFLHKEQMPKDLVAATESWIRISLPAAKRGFLKPGPLRISTHYPLGLFRAWSTLRLDIKCLIYPRPFTGSLKTSSDGIADGSQKGKNYPGTDDFQGLKSYQPGDSMQHIVWKAFSRGQGLFSKLFIEQAGVSVMLDWYTLSESNTEHKLSRLCGMVVKAHSLNLVYGLKLPGITIKPDCSEAHRQKCLKTLALYGLPSNQKMPET